MASTLGARSRATVVVATSLALTALMVGPASASVIDMTVDDGEDRGVTMGAGEAFLIFVGIPLVVAALVWLLVKAPAWTRSGRANETDAWTGDRLAVGTTAESLVALEPSAPTPGEPDGTGGTSARW